MKVKEREIIRVLHVCGILFSFVLSAFFLRTFCFFPCCLSLTNAFSVYIRFFCVFNGLHSKPNISLDAYRSFTRNPQIASVHRHWHCVKIVLHFNLLQQFFVWFISSTVNPSNAYTNGEKKIQN